MSEVLTKATELVKQAIEADTKGDLEQAQNLYMHALEHFSVVLRHEKNPSTKKMVQSRVETYLRRAEEIKESIKASNAAPAPVKKKAATSGGSSDADDAAAKNRLESTIVAEKPNVKWDDVAGLDGAKETLKETVILPERFPNLFTGERRPWVGVLLYGPPGTGKSFLAKAVATEADSKFLSATAADLVSKWLGEGEKNVRQLFQIAREQGPAIIFLDEVDSLCGSRSDGENEATRRIKTEFLTQMDGVKKGGGGARVLVLGATNTPWSLDPAVRRRFEKRIYIPLPDAPARNTMFRLSVGRTPSVLSDEDYDYLASQSEGFSGADISIVVRAALMEPLRVAQKAKFFKLDAEGLYNAVRDDPSCAHCPMAPRPGQPKPATPPQCAKCGAFRMSLYDVPGDKLKVLDVTREDLESVLKSAKPSVSPDELGQFQEWTNQFGQEG